MSKTKYTRIDISDAPDYIGIIVETTSLVVRSPSSGRYAHGDVDYFPPEINVTIAMRGQKGQRYEMNMMLNNNEKKIEGKLTQNGLNKVIKVFSFGDFNLNI